MYLNKVYVLGNLTRDPEMKAMPTGTNVTNFSVATNRVYKDNNGAKQEQVEYHNIVVFGKSAELCNQYLRKGQSVLVEGRIQTRSWDDATTNSKKYRTEIIADSVQFGPKAGAASNTISTEGDKSPSVSDKGNSVDNIDYGEEIDPNDIPF